jgi:hypothetical protein
LFYGVIVETYIGRSAYGYTKALVLLSTEENDFDLDSGGAGEVRNVNVHNQ